MNYPKDWEITTLSNLPIQIKKGDLITEKTVQKGKYPVIAGGKTPAYYCDKYNRDGLTITVSASGASAGYVSLHEGRIFASDCSTISKSNAYDVRYIYYLLLKEQKQIYSSQTGGAQPHIHPRDIQNISVVYAHDVKEQQAIADALTAFDTHINNLAKLIEKKKMIRDGTVEDLVSGKRRLAGFSGKWEECELNKLADIFDGTHQTPKYTLTGVPFVSVENITNLYNTDKFISESDFELEFKNIPEKGDILMTRIGDIGTASIVTRNSKLAYYVSLALFKHIKIYSEFLLYYIHSSAFQKELFDRSLNFAIPKKINKGEIGKCNVHFPTDIVEQQAIADILTSMDKEISDLEEEKEKYIALKAGAMDDLLTGKIRLV